jgi:ribonuclease HII
MDGSSGKFINLLEYDKRFFDKGYKNIIGADEAGRGPLAGPVVAGAVWIPHHFFKTDLSNNAVLKFQDSKMLSETQRETAFETLQEWHSNGLLKFAYGEASVPEIEKRNILYATTLAFRRALENLQMHLNFELPSKDVLLQQSNTNEILIIIDGYPFKKLPFLHTGLVKGDRTSFCIAAASIVAKVTRDHKMYEMAHIYPQYDFQKNKGYGTANHIAAIQAFGPCEIHRKSFLKKILPNTHGSSKQQQMVLPI